MRYIVQGEIFGVDGRRENCLVSLVERLDERQKGWHQSFYVSLAGSETDLFDAC